MVENLDVTATNLTVGEHRLECLWCVRGSGRRTPARMTVQASMHLEDIDDDLRLADLTLVAGQGTAD